MTALIQPKIYAQRHWTDQALIEDGFLSYRPVKRVTMARMLSSEEAPKTVKASGNAIIAQTGYWIAYAADEALKATLDDYKPRPIEPDIFAISYRPWNERNWRPTSTEAHLQQLSCKPYYKVAPVWAKLLTAETWVHSLESAWPTLVPRGEWLCVGVEGEPWSVTEAWFQAHYLLPGRRIVGIPLG